MQADIHPDYHPVIFVDTGAGFEFTSRSTMRSKETRDVDGVEHFVIRLDISSASHPFYTGKQRFVDTAGRIDKFRGKYGRRYGRRKAKDADPSESGAPGADAPETQAPDTPAPTE